MNELYLLTEDYRFDHDLRIRDHEFALREPNLRLEMQVMKKSFELEKKDLEIKLLMKDMDLKSMRYLVKR